MGANFAELEPTTRDFYRDAMAVLADAGIEFLVGGAYAFGRYTGIERHTKDFDLFLRQEDLSPALEELAAAGYQTEIAFPHWLGKAFNGEEFVDLIYGAGNGIAVVDDLWFRNAVRQEVLGTAAWLCPPEEMIWSKAFIMERERFDGADVYHLLHACAPTMDWDRLMDRFKPFPRLLLAHLILFGFVYPDQRKSIPERVMASLMGALRSENGHEEKVCYGTLLSRAQYIIDIGQWGYRDARLGPDGSMRPEDVAYWTAMIQKEK